MACRKNLLTFSPLALLEYIKVPESKWLLHISDFRCCHMLLGSLFFDICKHSVRLILYLVPTVRQEGALQDFPCQALAIIVFCRGEVHSSVSIRPRLGIAWRSRS